jgi:hypothetical protein
MQSRKTHLLAGATMLALLALIANIDAADVGVCAIVANPVNFDHQTVMLEGMVATLKETTSRRGNDYTTFKLQDRSGCGGSLCGATRR